MDTKKFFKLSREYCKNRIDEEDSHSCEDNGCGLCDYCYKEIPTRDNGIIEAAIRTLEEWDAKRTDANALAGENAPAVIDYEALADGIMNHPTVPKTTNDTGEEPDPCITD